MLWKMYYVYNTKIKRNSGQAFVLVTWVDAQIIEIYGLKRFVKME